MIIVAKPSKPFVLNQKHSPKRAIILAQYQQEIDSLYGSPAADPLYVGNLGKNGTTATWPGQDGWFVVVHRFLDLTILVPIQVQLGTLWSSRLVVSYKLYVKIRMYQNPGTHYHGCAYSIQANFAWAPSSWDSQDWKVIKADPSSRTPDVTMATM
jgi:hypothetical protein